MTIVAERDFIIAAALLDKTLGGRVWSTLRKLVQEPTPPGLNLERLQDAGGMESCRVNRDVRVILRRRRAPPPPILQLLYVGHHEDAYRWVDNHRFASPAQPTIGWLPALRLPGVVRELDRPYGMATLFPERFMGKVSDLQKLLRLCSESLATAKDTEINAVDLGDSDS